MTENKDPMFASTRLDIKKPDVVTVRVE